jgi:hypothetical protein
MYWFIKRGFVYINFLRLSLLLHSIPFVFIIFVKEL